MTMFGYLMKLALKVNDLHDYLIKEQGIPGTAAAAALIFTPIVILITVFLVSTVGLLG